ncbi:MAG: adenylate/guanylate cyclase domain-containing protein [Saprospiraceae bacterium]
MPLHKTGMSQPTLKSLLAKRSETTAWLQSWVEMSEAEISIEDHQHNFLFGASPTKEHQTYSVTLDDQILGSVKGAEHAEMIARLLSLMLQKEAERKKMGTEVLNLYQELNVIYNFSEKLTQTIDPDVIAQLTIEQAIHSISSHSGMIILWDEKSRQLIIPAKSGEPLFNEERLRGNTGLLLKIGLSGQSEIMNDIAVLKDNCIIPGDVQSLMYAAMKVKHRIMGAIILAGRDAEQYSAAHLKLLVTLAQQSSAAIESAMLYEKNIREVRDREEAILRIHEVTKKFVPIEFIRSLGKESLTDVMLGDQVEKIVTVLFTDIRDFTSLSEKMTPEENFHFISSFNARLGPIIRSNHGFINQYMGDSIMALFPENPEDALYAAIQMQQAVHELNTERNADGLPAIKAGIGMHTGPLIMGITGDEFRMDTATISDTVNTAARIESLTKYYSSPLLLSSETLRQITDREKYLLRHLGKVQLKGKYTLLSIIECLNGNPAEDLQKKTRTLPHFDKAMNYYLEQRFENAIQLFQDIISIDQEDHTAIYFMENALRYLRHGVPENWTGVEEMSSK